MAGAALTRFIVRGVFEIAFGCVLLALALVLVLRPAGTPPTPTTSTTVTPPPVYARVPLGLVLIAVVGLAAGMLGIGGAPPQVIVLTHVMQVPITRAMPTVQLVVLASALGGVAVHAAGGHFGPSPMLLVLLGAGAIVGAQAGAVLATRLSSANLMRLLATALFLVGGSLVAKSLG
jgi:uncharacterized membrane protein YfcA